MRTELGAAANCAPSVPPLPRLALQEGPAPEESPWHHSYRSQDQTCASVLEICYTDVISFSKCVLSKYGGRWSPALWALSSLRVGDFPDIFICGGADTAWIKQTGMQCSSAWDRTPLGTSWTQAPWPPEV